VKKAYAKKICNTFVIAAAVFVGWNHDYDENAL
jgi:hypothetical protein